MVVLRATLDALVSIREVVHLPFRWKHAPPGAERRKFTPAPIVGDLSRHPWKVPAFIEGVIPEPNG